MPLKSVQLLSVFITIMRKFITLFAIVCVFTNHLFAQTSEDLLCRLSGFMHNIHTFNRLYPQEKVWLHCDNTAYFQGDTIWFSAYVTSAETLRSAALSKVLYVELIDEMGEIVSTQQLQIESGRCHGQIPLNSELEKWLVTRKEQQKAFYPINPRTKNYNVPLPSGYYEIRAYTRAMLNWGTDICFSRIFPVFDTPEREGDYSQLTMNNRKKGQRELIENRIRLKSSKKERLNVCFYPEGGDIINGLPCRVAYKITSKEGRNLTAHCLLLADGEIITRTRTTHDGMGHFSFLPKEGVKYKLRVNTGESVRTFDLPDTRPQGLMLTVDATRADSIRMAVAATDSLLHKTIGMSITCRGKLLYFKVYDRLSQRPAWLPAIAKNKLSSGVNQINLFDANGQVYAERLFFVHDTAVIGRRNVGYRLDKKEYKPFEKINLIMFSHFYKEGQTGSLSVRDSGTEIGSPYTDNLQTYLLLTSDLKGYIHRPSYYFEADDLVHREHLDLLMMTQGWRRYAWKQLAGIEKFKRTHFMEEGLTLHGQIKHPKQKKTYLPNVRVAAIVSKGKEIMQEGHMITDNDGRFTFIMEPFMGRYGLSLNLTDESKRLVDGQFLLDRHFSPRPREIQFMEKQILSVPKPSSTTMGTDAYLLSDVQIKRERRQFEPFTLHNIREEREKALDTGDDKFIRISIEGYIEDKYLPFEEEILWSFKVSSTKKEEQKFISRKDFKGRRIKDFELEYVDYIQVYDKSTSHVRPERTTPLLNDQFKKNYKPICCWIYRKPKKIKGLRVTHIDGYSEVLDYYHPQYNREIIPGEVDYRRTLYWNPYVVLNKEGEAHVTFYNNSSCKQPEISIELSNN